MIEEKKISATIEKYVAGSVEYSKLLMIKKEMEDLIEKEIDSTFTKEEIDLARKYKDRVYFQRDIDLMYATNIPYSYRRYLEKALELKLVKIDKPEILKSYHDFLKKDDADSDFKKEHKDLYLGLRSKMMDMSSIINDLVKKIGAIDSTLSDKTMNITSVKKYYPQLYELMK